VATTWVQSKHTYEWLFQESGISLYLDGDEATWFDPSASGPWAPALDIAMYLMFAAAPNAPLTIYLIDIWTGTP
jgi:hypothetical protein